MCAGSAFRGPGRGRADAVWGIDQLILEQGVAPGLLNFAFSLKFSRLGFVLPVLRARPNLQWKGLCQRGFSHIRLIKGKWTRISRTAVQTARWPQRRGAWRVGPCRFNLHIVEQSQAAWLIAERGANSSLAAKGSKGARTPSRGRRIECRHARKHRLPRVLDRGGLFFARG
jgi:hypothetical protein